jgi:hypothetical protein
MNDFYKIGVELALKEAGLQKKGVAAGQIAGAAKSGLRKAVPWLLGGAVAAPLIHGVVTGKTPLGNLGF